MPAMQESHLHLEIAHVLFMDVVGYQKLPVNEEREVMQQTNSSARRHLAMGRLNSIQAELRKSTGRR
jgi:hypothetical protein